MKQTAAMGVDRLAALDADRLPDIALQELAVVLAACESCQAWPHQLPQTIGTLLPKKLSGDRVIGWLPHVARPWSQARGPRVRTWAEDCGAPWGASIRGNAALQEAFPRVVDEGMAARLGVAHGRIASFYDAIGWPRLGVAALRLEFPAEVLGLELLQCMAT